MQQYHTWWILLHDHHQGRLREADPDYEVTQIVYYHYHYGKLLLSPRSSYSAEK